MSQEQTPSRRRLLQSAGAIATLAVSPIRIAAAEADDGLPATWSLHGNGRFRRM
jgi:hypothetical protein